MMLCIHSCEIPDEYLKALEAIVPGAKLVPLKRHTAVYRAIQAHPDIFGFQLSSDTIICSPHMLSTLKRDTGAGSIKKHISASSPATPYPKAAILNAALIGKMLIHNSRITDRAIIEHCRQGKVTSLHVKQGYARCSVVPVGKKALITSDGGIAKAACSAGLDVLRVRPGHVNLPYKKSGLLGGASGILPDAGVIFLGDLTKHPDHDKISLFFMRHGVSVSHMPGLELFDAGSLFFLKTN